MRVSNGFVLDASSGSWVLRPASMEEQVKESLRAVVLTRQGERAQHPLLGSRLYRYLFRPMSESLLLEMKAEVKESIARSEPRVKVTEVELRTSDNNPEHLDLQVEFEYRQNRKTGHVKVELHG